MLPASSRFRSVRAKLSLRAILAAGIFSRASKSENSDDMRTLLRPRSRIRIYQLGLWSAIFFAIFLRLPPNNSPDSAGPFTSFDPVGFAIFATRRVAAGCLARKSGSLLLIQRKNSGDAAATAVLKLGGAPSQHAWYGTRLNVQKAKSP
jgi:hypothetical protein